MIMVPIKEALTFDDVTLAPKYSEILPSEVDTKTELSKNLTLKIPLLSSAMDTVTESKMAIAIAKAGGIGIIHRNLEIKKQIKEIKKVKAKKLLVGAAVGAGNNELKRAEAILNENVDLIVVDTAHGHSKKVAEIIKEIKSKKSLKTTLCAGNVATKEAAQFLIKLGVDVIKVGIGPGSICTTRLVAGIGVPQLSAILEARKGIKNNKTKIISDGGIKYSGDIAKALAAGADAVMIGSLFAGTLEAPGKLIKKKGSLYKNFRGMGSVGAMNKGSADRYFQKKQKDSSKYVPEGVEGLVKFKGDVGKIIYKLIGGLKSSMGYLGSKKVINLRNKPNFIKITKAGFYESMVHNVDEVKKDSKYP
jgi:IMP dehydrogenase